MAREEAQRFIYEYLSYEYLSDKVCVDCGEDDFAVLTFDPVRGKKKMDVSQMVAQRYSIQAIQEEITKCDVVCSTGICYRPAISSRSTTTTLCFIK